MAWKRSEHWEVDDFAAFRPWKWLPEKERKLRNGRFCCFCGVPLISAAFGGRKSRKSKGPWKWLPEKERILRNGRFCCFCGVPLISAAFGGRKSRKSKEPWKWLPEKERTLGNGRFCCFCGVPLISAAFGGRKSRKSKGPWKWLPEKERTLRNVRFCCFCGVPLISAAFGGRKSRKSTEPGNGTTIFLLLVFPSFWQLSAAGNPESPRGSGNGFRKRSEHWEMDDFAAFVVFPSFRQLSAAGNPENPRGPGNGFRKRSEHCEMCDFAAFVGFPSFRLFGGRKSRKSTGPGNGTTILLLLWGSPHFGSFRRPEIQKIQRALDMASGKGANIGKWTILLLLWCSPHFGSFRRPEIKKFKGPWNWLPEKERTLRNGQFCCFCSVPLISAAFGGRKSRKSTGPGNGTTILLLLWGSPHFGREYCQELRPELPLPPRAHQDRS